MIDKDAKTMKPNGVINRIRIRGQKGFKKCVYCNKTILASNRKD